MGGKMVIGRRTGTTKTGERIAARYVFSNVFSKVIFEILVIPRVEKVEKLKMLKKLMLWPGCVCSKTFSRELQRALEMLRMLSMPWSALEFLREP